ncbi:10845_t:CDS:2 [Funneliformis geosporum]|uniref:10845_t:CDS:1 n=1 Tax=Funneliformis geosporum TaxID=1117311 RepID=A0A9W4X2F1_9GLOM|nr:10845_t:CDS:2 [Funneliformis geosporum]
MDEQTFPFIEENLSSEIDRNNLLKLLNPTTNFDEDGSLSAKIAVSTARKNKDEYKIFIYAREREDVYFLVTKLQNLGLNYEFKIK